MHRSGLPNDTRLAPFLGLAALVHALVLLLPLARPADPAPVALRLALAQQETAPAASPAAARRPLSRPKPDRLPIVPLAPAPASLPSPVTDPSSAAVPGTESAQVIAQVRAALARYFVYPLAARRQGWQGEVVIGFSVTREGRIDHVEVVRSSGYRLLDEAARASLARVGNLPDYVSRDGEPLQVRMPVVYRLEG